MAEQSCDDVTATEGDDVTLECHVTGNPWPTVRWYRQSVLVAEGEQVRVGNVSRHDTDRYRCVADNGVGQPATCQTSLTVQCTFPVAFTFHTFQVLSHIFIVLWLFDTYLLTSLFEYCSYIYWYRYVVALL